MDNVVTVEKGPKYDVSAEGWYKEMSGADIDEKRKEGNTYIYNTKGGGGNAKCIPIKGRGAVMVVFGSGTPQIFLTFKPAFGNPSATHICQMSVPPSEVLRESVVVWHHFSEKEDMITLVIKSIQRECERYDVLNWQLGSTQPAQINYCVMELQAGSIQCVFAARNELTIARTKMKQLFLQKIKFSQMGDYAIETLHEAPFLIAKKVGSSLWAVALTQIDGPLNYKVKLFEYPYSTSQAYLRHECTLTPVLDLTDRLVRPNDYSTLIVSEDGKIIVLKIQSRERVIHTIVYAKTAEKGVTKVLKRFSGGDAHDKTSIILHQGLYYVTFGTTEYILIKSDTLTLVESINTQDSEIWDDNAYKKLSYDCLNKQEFIVSQTLSTLGIYLEREKLERDYESTYLISVARQSNNLCSTLLHSRHDGLVTRIMTATIPLSLTPSQLNLIKWNLFEYFEYMSAAPPKREEAEKTLAKLCNVWSGDYLDVIKRRDQFAVILAYLLNDSYFLKLVIEKVASMEKMIREFNLISLALSTSKQNSFITITERVDVELEHKAVKEFVPSAEMRRIVVDNEETLVTNRLAANFLKRLLLVSTGHAALGEPKNPDYTVVAVDKSKHNQIDGLVRTLFTDRFSNTQDFEVFRTGFDLDLSLGSEFSAAFYNILSSMDEETLTSTFKGLIYYKWSLCFPSALVFSVLYWANSILSYIYYGYLYSEIGIGITIIVLTAFFLILEIKSMLTFRSQSTSRARKRSGRCKGIQDYFSKSSNLYDLVTLLFTIVSACIILAADKNPLTTTLTTSLGYAWIRAIPVMLLGARSITWLRVFGPTRYLITSVMQVFHRMLPFLLILSCCVLLYAYLWRLADTLSDTYPSGGVEYPFYTSLAMSVNLIFGNTPDPVDGFDNTFPVVKYCVYILGNVVLSLTLLNFLIAVLSGVIDSVTENKQYHDINELLILIDDIERIYSNIGQSREKKIATLLILLPKKPESEDPQYTLVLEDIKKQLSANTEAISALTTLIKSKQPADAAASTS